MAPARAAFVCVQCRLATPRQLRPWRPPAISSSIRQLHSSSSARRASVAPVSESSSPAHAPARSANAPKAHIDIKHIRQNPELYAANCLERNYKAQAEYPARINGLFEQWQACQRDARSLRERSNVLRRQIANPKSIQRDGDSGDNQQRIDEARRVQAMSKDELLGEARALKDQLSAIEAREAGFTREMEDLAILLPNLTSEHSPRGEEPRLLTTINEHPHDTAASDGIWRSHVHIGSELGLLDFAGAATTSGWGWYYLVDEGAQLEQALIAYALAVVTKHGWTQVSPPSIVYSHITAACGFQPRDANGEQQIYTLAQSAGDAARGKPELSLTATAEIPLAGMKADTTLDAEAMPLKRVAVSRCYRAEAGARGADTKGLYRVHEFTKVEMFAWTLPDEDEATDVFDEMLDIQTEILQSLDLHCRVLEMPTADLGASASRKCDIEAFFPSRVALAGAGFGEVTSASICTDYQARRLATRVRGATSASSSEGGGGGGKLGFPYTVNGTALAVPRVLAAILENGWDEQTKTVTVPHVLRQWMDGKEKLGLKKARP
ncbi:putative mitochondrial serine--tRNA ligase [Microdochium trichocladiopsis]|uniref:serine--tRNA ligase n=1 Tax=Microdochium trichocladiopsis TaxID=1682393 RepID=A0A9P9BTV8_9PEZI|nr:putative mitochondrial serine--tRNA ligase [Microdochium trichocladiopsis]KAH7040391.1 putative mitochondrial serine--tRNA ligase [Microdochium trichocladiopsis]